MNSKPRNKAIFLDWNGTLSDSFFWEHMRNSDNKDTKELYKKWDTALFSKSKDYLSDWMRGKGTTESVLTEIAKETDTRYEKLLKEFIKGCKSMALVSDELPQIVKTLKSKGFYVVIATNNMDCFTRWTVPSMGLEKMFDEILNSFYLKGLKHDIDKKGKSIFFDGFFTKYKVSPINTVFLDDSIDKNGYIASLGIKYIQIDDSHHLVQVLKSF